MPKKSFTRFHLILLLLVSLLLSGCASFTPAVVTPEIVTIVQTVPVEVEVPVEVTRFIEVTRLVEVTRQVVQTELVPVTVTPTPSPEATGTSVAPTPGLIALGNTPTYGKPAEKVPGIAPLRVWNTTEDTLEVVINGPVYYQISLAANKAVFLSIKEARYTYLVYRDGNFVYKGEMNISNPDKYELHLKEERAAFLIP